MASKTSQEQSLYARLVEHLANYRNIARVERLQLKEGYYNCHLDYFFRQIERGNLCLAATFLCNNFEAFNEFDRECGPNRLSSGFSKALGLAAMLQTKEMKTTEKKLIADWEC